MGIEISFIKACKLAKCRTGFRDRRFSTGKCKQRIERFRQLNDAEVLTLIAQMETAAVLIDSVLHEVWEESVVLELSSADKEKT